MDCLKVKCSKDHKCVSIFEEGIVLRLGIQPYSVLVHALVNVTGIGRWITLFKDIHFLACFVYAQSFFAYILEMIKCITLE